MDSLDIISLIVLALFALLGIGVATVLGFIPGYIARRRHSPWVDPINICGWVGVVVPPVWLEGHYLWDAVLADFHHRAGNAATAKRHRDQALAAAPSTAVRQLLQRRLTKPHL